MTNSLPVLITAFLREAKTIALLERLATLGISNIYVSMDKGRNSQEIESQTVFLEHLKQLGREHQLDLKINVKSQNQGLAVSIITAADWFFHHENFGVILEDDLIPSEKFFEFCLENRELIETDNSLLLISGNSFGEGIRMLEPNYINYPLIWGWATSRKKWEVIKSEITIRNYFSWPALIHPSKSGFFVTGLLRARKGKIDSWAVPLASRMYFGHYKCLIPPSNLVANNGNDVNSTHSNSNDWMLNHPIQYIENANYHVKKVHFSRLHNKVIEREIYGIRWFHVFGPLNAFFFDRYRKFQTLLPLLDRLRQSK
jgi:hypothetical protein